MENEYKESTKDDLICIVTRLDNLFKTEFKEYVLKYLKKLSNNYIYINKNEEKIIELKYVLTDYEVIKRRLINCIDGTGSFDTKDIISGKYTVADGELVRLRDIFGFNSSLTNIMKIVELIVSEKNNISNINNQDDINSLYKYISCLIHNIMVLVVYFYDNFSDDLDIDPSDVINFRIEENSDYDLDKELKKLELESDYINEYTEEADVLFEEKENKKAKDYIAFLKNIGKTILKVNSIVNKNLLNIKNFFQKMNVARSIFYKKNIGRIDHLFKNYADEAVINENEVKGDPVVIIDSVLPNYMNNVINGVLKIYNDYNKHIDQLFTASTLQDMITKINKYITYPNAKLDDKSDVKHINTSLKLDLRYKVASIILDNNDVYGYTVDSIVLNKYPPLNHLLVSLFLKRPHEYPKEQPVIEIFETADSFKVLNNRFKDYVTTVATIADRKLSSIHMQDDIKKISSNIQNYSKNNLINNKSKFTEGASKEDADKAMKKDFKQRLSVLKNHEHLFQSFIPIFLYIANAGVVIYNIAVRVDKTARDAIDAMIEVEKSKTDATSKYKTGVGTDKKKEPKKETKKDKLYKTSKDVALQSRNDSGDKVAYFSGSKSVRKIAGQK